MAEKSTSEQQSLKAAAASGTVLSHWADRQPHSMAIVSEHGDRTFAELDAEANRLVRALRRSGLRAGDGVAAMISNRAEFAAVLAAAQRAGLRFTPVNWHLTADEAAYIVDDSEAAAFVADARFAAVAAAAARNTSAASTRLAVAGPIEGFDDYDDALAAELDDAIDDPEVGTTMLYTSGTTGRPKGVHRNRAAAAAAAALAVRNRWALPPLDYQPGESMHLCTGPAYHAAPLAFSLAGPLTAGVGVVLMDGWSAHDTLRLIETHAVTHSHMVPTMFHRMLSLPDTNRDRFDLSSLRYVWHGAAPCPVTVKQAIIEWWGPVLLEYYAATEGTGTWVASEEWLTKPGTVGRVPVEGHIRILDDDGNDLEPGQTGTIYLRAAEGGRFEYFKDPTKTASSYRDDYFTLGDVGFLDADDYLYLTDRSANLIISGGVNIYPAEIEAELLDHEAVGDVGVIGVPDADWGESVLAVVELRPEVVASDELADELVEHCRSRLAHYKCPRSVDFVDQLPRADNGKLYKRRLREQYREQASTAGDTP
ncbi:MAG: AMP-binding protein [Acidimicrobiales bacterium]